MISPKDKRAAVRAWLKGSATLRELADKYGVHHSSIEKWVYNYRVFGMAGLRRPVRSRRYTEEEKQQAVKCYLTEQRSLYSVCRQYKIRTLSTLQSWVAQYEESVEK